MTTTTTTTTDTNNNKVIRVRLELHAQQLKNVAGFGRGTSDPFAIVTLLSNQPNRKPTILGKTEVIENTLSPRWITTFDLDYELSQNTRINVGIWDDVSIYKKKRNNKKTDPPPSSSSHLTSSSNLTNGSSSSTSSTTTTNNNNKPMGSAMFEVGEVLGARGNTKAKKLRNGGTLFARITTAPIQSMGILHIQLQGYHIKNVDGFFHKSDPFFILSSKVTAAGGLTWQPVYRSDPIMNNLNPIWPIASIDIARLCDGDFNKPIQMEVYDWDKKGKNILIGKFETSVQGLLSSVVEENSNNTPNISKAFTIFKMKRDTGKIIVTQAKLDGYVPPPSTTTTTTTTTTNGSGPTPMILASNNTTPPVYPITTTTTTHTNQNNPTDNIPAFGQALDRPPPPTFTTTATMVTAAATISSSSSSSSLSNLQHPNQQQQQPTFFVPPSAPMGSPHLLQQRPVAQHQQPLQLQSPRPKFTDYLMGGCELELMIAIDFTGSNGDPRKPGTLHYRHPDNITLNDYEKAITAVGGVLARYDSDQKFSVYGFGAKYNGIIQHCFQVGKNDELDGLLGVLEAYRNVFRTGLTMSGPTVFSEVIDYAAASARSKQEEYVRMGKQAYKVLLILTDGEVTDMDLTKRAIHAASDAPLSIVIVGIGNANFGMMQTLDDFQDLNGKIGGRDIVQFVSFSEHMHDRSSLTRATLDELPDQLVDYFTQRNIRPLPPIRASQLSLVNVDDPTDEDIDLTIDVDPDGEISLVDYGQIPTYDDTKYNTFSDYSTIAPLPVPVHHQQQQPTIPYHPNQQYGQQQPYIVQAQPYIQQQSMPQPLPPPQQQQPINYFHVQVPPNGTPGMQLQIQNPKTLQFMIVSIPHGIPPGGTFAVQY